MNKQLKLLAVLAHPDDESLGFGGTLAKYAAEGVETYLVTATRGERGRFGSLGKGGDPIEVGRVREQELRAAAAVLGISEVSILNYSDGALDEVAATTAIRAVVSHIRRIQPDVVVTFGPEGAYGHPDHIAISQFTTRRHGMRRRLRIPRGRYLTTASTSASPRSKAVLPCVAKSQVGGVSDRLSQTDVNGRRR